MRLTPVCSSDPAPKSSSASIAPPRGHPAEAAPASDTVVGLTCGACKQPILDSNGNPRTSSAHSCRTCGASLHSVVMCDNVWQPLEDGGGNYMGQDTHSPRLGIAVFVHGLGLQSQSLKTGWDCSPSPKPVPQSSRDCSPSPRPVPQNARDCSPSPLTLSLKIAQNHKRNPQKLLKSLKIAQNSPKLLSNFY